MTKRLSFLIGILLGQVIMTPWLIKFIKSPKIEAVIISDAIFQENFSTRMAIIKNVPHKGKKKDLKIFLTTEQKVQDIFFRRYGKENDAVLGFYDRQRPEIVSIDNTDSPIHELRHVFEGRYHR